MFIMSPWDILWGEGMVATERTQGDVRGSGGGGGGALPLLSPMYVLKYSLSALHHYPLFSEDDS